MMFALRYSVYHAFDNNNGTIHNEPEIDGSQAHQVARNAEKVHQRNGKKHGKRDYRCHNQACTQVAQQQYQYKNYDQGAFEQVARNGSYGTAYQFGAVEVRFNFYTLGQRFLNNIDAAFNIIDYLVCICAFQHHHYATHCLSGINNQGPVAGCIPETDSCHIANQYRNAGRTAFNYNFFNIVERFYQPDATDKIGGWLFIDICTARVFIISLQGIENIGKCKVHPAKAFRIYGYFVLFYKSAVAVNVGHTGRSQHFAAYYPILQRT